MSYCIFDIALWWKQRWKQTRGVAITAATETLDPEVEVGGSVLMPAWILDNACLKPQACLDPGRV